MPFSASFPHAGVLVVFAAQCLYAARIAPESFRKITMPFYEPSSFSMGGEDEAVCCVSEIGDGWRSTPGAIEWLEQAAPKKAKR